MEYRPSNMAHILWAILNFDIIKNSVNKLSWWFYRNFHSNPSRKSQTQNIHFVQRKVFGQFWLFQYCFQCFWTWKLSKIEIIIVEKFMFQGIICSKSSLIETNGLSTIESLKVESGSAACTSPMGPVYFSLT